MKLGCYSYISQLSYECMPASDANKLGPWVFSSLPIVLLRSKPPPPQPSQQTATHPWAWCCSPSWPKLCFWTCLQAGHCSTQDIFRQVILIIESHNTCSCVEGDNEFWLRYLKQASKRPSVNTYLHSTVLKIKFMRGSAKNPEAIFAMA